MCRPLPFLLDRPLIEFGLLMLHMLCTFVASESIKLTEQAGS